MASLGLNVISAVAVSTGPLGRTWIKICSGREIHLQNDQENVGHLVQCVKHGDDLTRCSLPHFIASEHGLLWHIAYWWGSREGNWYQVWHMHDFELHLIANPLVGRYEQMARPIVPLSWMLKTNEFSFEIKTIYFIETYSHYQLNKI